MVRKTITTEVRGKQSGTTYDDRRILNDPETSVIKRIVVTHDEHVSSLGVFYNDSGAEHSGTRASGSKAEILLGAGEFITTVTGRSDPEGHTAGYLEFTSTKWGPFGKATGGEVFRWNYFNIPSQPGTRMGLLYFTGSFANYLGHIQATFAEYPDPSAASTEVRYERRATWEPGAGVPPTLPLFARNLMSPVIFLQVGPNPVTFHAYEDIICCLPFFQAALHGGFREATDKIIRMPDDDADTVASLLEFLYLGTYTYTFDAATPGDVPAKDIAEASFHVRLHALACKYDCGELAALERRSVAYVLDGLDGMEVVKVVKEMYESGWMVKDWDEKLMRTVKGRIPGIMKTLYKTCDDELEAVWGECPGLAQELLRLVVLS